MVDNFFQERFNKNIKFYEKKTEQELEENYNYLYDNIEKKDIYLAELAIIKKTIKKEQESKITTQINFNDYISIIDELYNQIEKMNPSEIYNHQANIELIITALKLSLNSPTCFKVNVERLKNINLNSELNTFISNVRKKGEISNTSLKQLKKELLQEIGKQQYLIEIKKKRMRNTDILKNFEDLYYKLNANQIDLYAFMGAAFQLNFTQEEKRTILDITQKRIMDDSEKNKELFNYKISSFISDFKKINELINNDINEIKNGINTIKKISENIDDNGFLIQKISDEEIDKYINIIDSLNLDIVSLTQEMLKQQNRFMKKQRIDQIANQIENKTEILSKKQAEEKKIESSNKTNYSQILSTANKILTFITESNYNLELDELESIFVEELKNNKVDEEKIEEIMNSASSEECRMKFIIYGLKYQLENINQNDVDKSMNLIKLYIEKFGNCYTKLKNEQATNTSITPEQFDKKIEEIKEELFEIKNQIDEDIIKQLDSEKIEDLESYSRLIFENMNEREKKKLDYFLEQSGLDFTTLKLYKTYVNLKGQISETEILIEMINEEKLTEFLPQAEEKIKLISNLLKQYNDSKKAYEKEQINRTKSSQKINNNIVVYFETDDGITQVEERMMEDSKIYGKYKPAELKNIEHLITLLKEGTKKEIDEKSKAIVQTKLKTNKSSDATFGRRISTSGSTRLAYKQIPSSVLNTDKPVYLVISGGKKMSDNSAVYEDAIYLSDKVNKFISEYESLTTEEQKQSFMDHQQKLEKRLIEILQNGRGKNDETTIRK